MNKKKKEKELRDATTALLGWFESQQISLEDAVPVMVHAIVALIHAHVDDPKAIKRGKDLVARMIMDN